LSFQSENSLSKPKIRFVKHLRLYCDAICLYWIDEIHIDESFRNSKILDDLIKHELKHYYLIKRIIKAKEENKTLKAILLSIYNDIFDLLDSLKLDIKRLILKCKK